MRFPERSCWLLLTKQVTWTKRGGHFGMPGDLDLGRPGAKGLHPQLLAWMRAAL